MVTVADEQVSVVARGFSPRELERYAARECDQALGGNSWRFTQAEVLPCMVSLGGRARLYEGHFVARALEPVR